MIFKQMCLYPSGGGESGTSLLGEGECGERLLLSDGR